MVRPALADDLPAIVSMAHTMKRRLAEWSPVYFRPRAGAEARHAAYLGYLVDSKDHVARVLVEAEEVVGFFAVAEQPAHRWVDDLYLEEPRLWSPAVAAVVEAVTALPWVTCVSRFDVERSSALEAVGLCVVSTYWGRTLDLSDDHPRPASDRLPELGTCAPRHTFGGTPFDPAAPGALLIDDGAGGVVVGSASMEPPLYDPGGPACVVDRINGPDRGALLAAAMETASARGDVGLVVVSDRNDPELVDLLERTGFRAEVDLYACL
jgi:hypothetical protein